MNIDPSRMLDARSAEAGRSEAQSAHRDFPEVFESKLEAAAARDAGPEGEVDADGAAGRDVPDASDAPEARSALAHRADEQTPDEASDPAKAEAEAEAAAESGAVGGETGPLAERVRVQAEAERPPADRGAETADRSSASRAASGEGLEEGEALDEDQARQAISRMEAEGLVAADGDEASATADAAMTGAVASGVPQATAGVAEGAAGASPEIAPTSDAPPEGEGATAMNAAGEREASPEQNASQEQTTPRAPDESLFERVAETSAQSAVDPSAAQAVASAEEAQRAPEVVAMDAAPAVASPVSGQVTETTTTATPGSPQPVAASEAISVQTEWLATRGGGTARLVLHPPELGEIAIRVSLRGGTVEVVMVAQDAVAQGMAEEQSERLAQAFANRDLRLEHFEVRRGTADDLPNDEGGRFAESETDRDGRSNDERAGRSPGIGGGEGADDAPLAVPRILTRAPETGVDLRI